MNFDTFSDRAKKSFSTTTEAIYNAMFCRRFSYRRLIFCILLLIGCCQVYVYFQSPVSNVPRINLQAQISPAVEFRTLPASNDGRHKIWSFVWRAYERNKDEVSIGIATQCSLKNMKDLEILVKHWNGPISITTFLIGNELDAFKKYLKYFVNCNPLIAKRVSFHVVFPISHPPPAVDELDMNINYEKGICLTRFNVENDAINYDNRRAPYPVNVLRNVAIRGLGTSHVIVIDVDMIPSLNLKNVLLKSPLLTQNLSALVIPAFEMRNGLKVPVTKTGLIEMWNNGEMRPFYQKVCWKCQKYTLYDQWKAESNSGLISYRVNWYDPWEPFYVAARKDIVYDERFEQYGFNRISQLCHLHISGYTFSVLYNSYIIHKGFKEKTTFHSSKDEENEKNKLIYRKLKAEMTEKYSKSARHC